jgi:hypothetical protein
MGDLKTPFDKPIYGDTGDLSGDLPTSRGTDPLTDTGGSSGLQTIFDKPIMPSLDGQESANSVSGLPLQPNRFQPSETPPEPPSLTDRNPGTIDKR